jgi:c-di-GMP-binding flagellar brake protein YcgR
VRIPIQIFIVILDSKADSYRQGLEVNFMHRALRMSCGSHGTIKNKGILHKVVLENISLNGALLVVEHDKQSILDTNKIFQLALCDNPDLCPPMYACRVVRVTEDGKVGIKFLEQVWNSTGLA